MSSIGLLFPNQLFEDSPLFALDHQDIILIEHSLFFGDEHHPMRMHKQKLAYHRASMAEYADYLGSKGINVRYVHYQADTFVLNELFAELAGEGITKIDCVEVDDYIIEKRLQRFSASHQLSLTFQASPAFLNSMEENIAWRRSRKRWFMADFYQWQRKRFDILMDGNKPVGGKWSFDEENRKKLPKKEVPYIPQLAVIEPRKCSVDAVNSITLEFSDHPGELERILYPTTFSEAKQWLDLFLEQRFEKFGTYEDAIVAHEHWLYHSVLTPMLNVGLLTPGYIVQRVLAYYEQNQTPLNSVEGFIRQVIGWREFMRATYHDLGVEMRTTNHWQHTRPMPAAFYNATTGIEPIDTTIKHIIKTGYCHHIERLMVLGGFMFLCGIDPKAVYRWFMEMFIDSYDWVMVPNVYAMSQHADGGNITTKPYFSGSNYIIKMSHYKKGAWSDVWDALFWSWIISNRADLVKKPRWAMMCRQSEKMSEEKQEGYLRTAEEYLRHL